MLFMTKTSEISYGKLASKEISERANERSMKNQSARGRKGEKERKKMRETKRVVVYKENERVDGSERKKAR